MDAKILSLGFLVAAASSLGGANWRRSDPMFDSNARESVRKFWTSPGAYKVESTGKRQVRLTVEGSKWLHKYNRALGRSKGDPAVDAAAQTTQQQEWESWINLRVEFDRAQAQREADALEGIPLEPSGVEVPPPDCPESLITLVELPPRFAEAVIPNRHTIQLKDGTAFTLEDNVPMRPRYLYYRFREGVMSGGTPTKSLPKEEVDKIFRDAGISESEQRIMSAVSSLEGGFDSINTYDTGFVSVGLIQFACLSTGSGSLGAVLRREKSESPEAFQRDFRAYGLDVTEEAKLVVYDDRQDREFVGAEAAAEIIRQPRFALAFRRAGQLPEFRTAQLRVAKALYFPTEFDTVPINVGSEKQQVSVLDLFATEAGLATLMDRKVHLGTHDPLPTILANLGKEINAQSLEDYKKWEGEIIFRLKHRRDYQIDPNLSKPGPSTRMRDASRSSRGGGGKRSGGNP